MSTLLSPAPFRAPLRLDRAQNNDVYSDKTTARPVRSVQPLSFRSATVRRRYPIPGTNSARDRQTTHRVLHHVTKMLLEPISCTQYYIYSIMMGGSSYNISSSLCNGIIISTVATPAAHLQCTLLAAAASTVAVRAHTFMYMYRSCLLF